MENTISMLRKVGDWALGRDMPAPPARRPNPEPAAAEVARPAGSESFTMRQVERFFSAADAPQGNALVSEIVDENGPLPGREQSGGRRRIHGLEAHFSDDASRPVLFAPNDAPDELQQEPTELQALLRQ
ncbi:MAG: hypothetical protein ABWY05_16750 [Noviherbaspirillum sp.]